MGTITYKEYEGTVDFDSERHVLRGKVLFVNDLITYEATDVATLQSEFEAAIEDYLETCKELGRQPQKPCSGQFNVRISPELHRAAVTKSVRDGTSLNDIVVRSLEAYLHGRSNIENHFNVTFNMLEESAITAASTSTMPTVWEERRVHH